MKYLITYACDNEYYSELLTMPEIANLIGFADCNDCYDFRIYRMVNGQPDLLRYDKDCHPGCCSVILYTYFGKELDSCEYAEH